MFYITEIKGDEKLSERDDRDRNIKTHLRTCFAFSLLRLSYKLCEFYFLSSEH